MSISCSDSKSMYFIVMQNKSGALFFPFVLLCTEFLHTFFVFLLQKTAKVNMRERVLVM